MSDGSHLSDTTRRGNISQRVQNLSASGIRRFFDILDGMEGVISLGVGQPDFVTPSIIRNAAIKSIEDGQTYYTSNYGIIELRQAISRNLERLYGVYYEPATEIIVTSGVSEGQGIVMQSLLDIGDEVLCPDPHYVAYPATVTLADGVFVPVPTSQANDFKVRAEDIEARITPRTKAIMLGYPANPTGAVMERDDLLPVADVARKHNLFVISDEIYDRLVYGTKHTCVASLPSMRERTVLLGGFSKAYAMTGWRIAYVAARGDIIEGIMKAHQYVMMSAPTVAQYAALEAMLHGEEDMRGMVAEYDRRRRLIVDGFNAIGLSCFEPRGAFYAFPSVGVTGLSDESFAEELLMEEKVAVVPGSAFGECGAGHVRACYAQSYELIEEALVRMRRFVERHRR
jgi:aminotransferase